MAEHATRRYTYAEYRELERASEVRHEWYDGHILAMAGGTVAHARICSNVHLALGRALDGSPCEPFGSDLRIRIPETGLATYPDLSVVCGGEELHPEDPDAVTNPRAIVEVLSKSTEAYDRGQKFRAHYAALGSLRHYVLVAQYEALVEHYERNDDGTWTLRHLGREDTLRLLDVEIPVARIYRGVELVPEEAPDVPTASRPG